MSQLVEAYAVVMRAARRLGIRAGLLEDEPQRDSNSLFSLWFRSLFSVFDLHDFLRLDLPWWTFDSGHQVEEFLKSRSGARVFEWGSGASTVWLAKRAKQVTSIEYDMEWFDALSPLAPENVDLRFVPAGPRNERSLYGSKRWGYRGFDFGEYVCAIDSFPNPFDLIVIDGRAREACLHRAISHLAPGGLIVLDNVNRRRYRKALRECGDLLEATITTGLTPILPWPTQTAVLSHKSKK